MGLAVARVPLGPNVSGGLWGLCRGIYKGAPVFIPPAKGLGSTKGQAHINSIQIHEISLFKNMLFFPQLSTLFWKKRCLGNE